jgi:hypothetical protein
MQNQATAHQGAPSSPDARPNLKALLALILATCADDYLFDDAETAVILDTVTGTLSVWRSTGRYNLPFVKIGRKVRYRAGDLRAFLAKRTATHTGNAA